MRVAALLFGIALAAGTAAIASDQCEDDRVDLRGDWGQASFGVELALTPEERGRGLMDRPSMPRSHGMLFVFDPPRSVSFWMRNTLIPLDMIFVDRQGVVQKVHENAVPLDETSIHGGDRIFAVLEVNGGLSAQFGLGAGSELRHPIFGNEAIWTCSVK